jgi:hypothetical protein
LLVSLVKFTIFACRQIFYSQNLIIHAFLPKKSLWLSPDAVVSKIDIHNALGQLVFTVFKPQAAINIAHLPKGLSLIKIFSDKATSTQKIMIF